jgi:hypothetical protein
MSERSREELVRIYFAAFLEHEERTNAFLDRLSGVQQNAYELSRYKLKLEEAVADLVEAGFTEEQLKVVRALRENYARVAAMEPAGLTHEDLVEHSGMSAEEKAYWLSLASSQPQREDGELVR